MALRLNGSNTGYVELDVPAAAGSHTLTLPNSGGSSGQYLRTDGSGGLSWQTLPAAGTTWTESSASLSGASQEWTGIPSTARQIIISHHGWTNASSSERWVQIGDSGGFETTGYYLTAGYYGTSYSGTRKDNVSAFIQDRSTSTTVEKAGLITLTRTNSSNMWIIEWHSVRNDGLIFGLVGNKNLSGTLDRVRILPGSGNFSAGTANLMYLS